MHLPHINVTMERTHGGTSALGARINFLLLITILYAPAASSQAIGTGKTFGEALARAQQNALSQQMWERVGESMAAYAREKVKLAEALKEVRAQYWNAAASGKVPRELEQRYQEILWRKDYHFLEIEIANFIKPASPGSSVKGGGTLLDSFSRIATGGRDPLEGIYPYAQSSFDSWIGHLKILAPQNGFNLVATLLAGRETYAVYQQRRDVAEFLFQNPNSPLKSPDPGEFLVGWLLASDFSATFAEAQRRTEAMLRLVGREAFNRAVEAARQGKLKPTGLTPKSEFDPVVAIADHLQNQYLDWLATKHDPRLYAIQLIKRSTSSDWDWSAAAYEARIKRLGSEPVRAAVQEAFRAAEDTRAPCVGNPHLQYAKTSTLPDCVADKLGPFTIWEDALDISLARMNRSAMKARMLEHLRAAPQRGDAATRYARITSVVAEPLLLAALYQQGQGGLDPLIGRQPNRGGWRPFQEELRVLEGFAATRDDRSFAVTALTDGIEGEDLERLELAVAEYRRRAASLGEERLLAAARGVRQRAQPSSRGLYGYGELLKQQLGESKPAASGERLVEDQATREIRAKLQSIPGRLGLQLLGPLNEPLRRHYLRTGASQGDAMRQLLETQKRTDAALQEAIAAFERYGRSQSEADLQAGLAAGEITLKEIELAYDCLRREDPTLEILQPSEPSSWTPRARTPWSGSWAGNLQEEIQEVLAFYSAQIPH